ncbi:serine/threonine protein kinase [Tautonia plasticadhaerens]|uniref:Serine/threonine-protein kinase PrkC n=1 Tax=Tautonia plasticadhaerens TaxID=2527974 RepID=A0A518GYU5_9BACT|nr:serine/threonine-protein kinase [Tautonia plasticadhaerens]QDV33771.1 Serine/threonine-protein kinase PrkC [Tautonia plasticadhaerens]
MATSERSKSDSDVPAEFLRVLKRAGILSESRLADIRSKVLAGDYPIDSTEMARKLVKDRVLTEYQARRLLSNRPGGLIIGRYIILEKLGAGSMGRVYKAQHRMMNRISALKIIAPEISNNQRVVARFQREMRLVGKLNHPNIIQAFDADKDRGILYIAMEYVDGDSLGQRLRSKGVIPPETLAEYASQAALGLQHAHERGIIHRDVKPSNLLLGTQGVIKVLDLGLATLHEADEDAQFKTADGVAVGTIDYMSPEQACGRDVDPRSDLFSLGCTMYHLLTGRLPFPGNSPVERLGARITGAHVPIPSVKPETPRRLVEVMDRLLANSPGDRYGSAAEAAEALHSVFQKLPPSPARVPAPAEPAPTPPRPQPPQIKYVHVTPSYPAWFQPIARLAEGSAVGALLLLIGLLLLAFAAGVVVGFLI